MRQLTFLLFFSLVFINNTFADVKTEKEMSKISRDNDTYLSADVRAQTEEEAYQEALKQLSDKVTDYFREQKGETIPDAIYMSDLKNQYEKLSSHLSTNRFRVLLYVKKSDLIPFGNSNNAIVLSKNDENAYAPITPEVKDYKIERLQQKEEKNGTNEIEKKTLTPILSELISETTGKAFSQKLVLLRKENKIKGAAAFPISNFNNFYIAVINTSDQIIGIYLVENGKMTNISNGELVEMSQFENCSAYWFTLP